MTPEEKRQYGREFYRKHRKKYLLMARKYRRENYKWERKSLSQTPHAIYLRKWRKANIDKVRRENSVINRKQTNWYKARLSPTNPH